MKRIVFLIIMIINFASFNIAAAEEIIKIKPASGNITNNIRDKPSANAKIIGKVFKDEVFKILDRFGKSKKDIWFKIGDNEWIHNSTGNVETEIYEEIPKIPCEEIKLDSTATNKVAIKCEKPERPFSISVKIKEIYASGPKTSDNIEALKLQQIEDKSTEGIIISSLPPEFQPDELIFIPEGKYYSLRVKVKFAPPDLLSNVIIYNKYLEIDSKVSVNLKREDFELPDYIVLLPNTMELKKGKNLIPIHYFDEVKYKEKNKPREDKIKITYQGKSLDTKIEITDTPLPLPIEHPYWTIVIIIIATVFLNKCADWVGSKLHQNGKGSGAGESEENTAKKFFSETGKAMSEVFSVSEETTSNKDESNKREEEKEEDVKKTWKDQIESYEASLTKLIENLNEIYNVSPCDIKFKEKDPYEDPYYDNIGKTIRVLEGFKNNELVNLLKSASDSKLASFKSDLFKSCISHKFDDIFLFLQILSIREGADNSSKRDKILKIDENLKETLKNPFNINPGNIELFKLNKNLLNCQKKEIKSKDLLKDILDKYSLPIQLFESLTKHLKGKVIVKVSKWPYIIEREREIKGEISFYEIKK